MTTSHLFSAAVRLPTPATDALWGGIVARLNKAQPDTSTLASASRIPAA